MEGLRRLAERPGTEAEGRVAREMLAKLEAESKAQGSTLEESADWLMERLRAEAQRQVDKALQEMFRASQQMRRQGDTIDEYRRRWKPPRYQYYDEQAELNRRNQEAQREWEAGAEARQKQRDGGPGFDAARAAREAAQAEAHRKRMRNAAPSWYRNYDPFQEKK